MADRKTRTEQGPELENEVLTETRSLPACRGTSRSGCWT